MSSSKKYHFSKELRLMLYGFGDVQHPRSDSVAVLEDMLMDFISDLLLTSIKLPGASRRLVSLPNASSSGAVATGGEAGEANAAGSPESQQLLTYSSKVRTEEVLYALRKEPKKLARAEELLWMNEELKRARKLIDVDEMNQAKLYE